MTQLHMSVNRDSIGQYRAVCCEPVARIFEADKKISDILNSYFGTVKILNVEPVCKNVCSLVATQEIFASDFEIVLHTNFNLEL